MGNAVPAASWRQECQGCKPGSKGIFSAGSASETATLWQQSALQELEALLIRDLVGLVQSEHQMNSTVMQRCGFQVELRGNIKLGLVGVLMVAHPSAGLQENAKQPDGNKQAAGIY